MEEGLYVLLFLLIFCPVMYLLYRQGLVMTKSIRAILFVFRPGKNGDKVSLNSCTGWVRHRGRFQESRTYLFSLDAKLSKGTVEATLLDQKKQPLLKLNPEFPSQSIDLDGKSRYYLRWEFKSATGKCELRWL